MKIATFDPTVDEPRAACNKQEEPLVINFVRSGRVVLRSTSLMEDIIDPKRGNVVPLAYLTDGTWLWSSDIAYYIGAHHAQIQKEFLDYVRSTGYSAREPSTTELEEAKIVISGRMV